MQEKKLQISVTVPKELSALSNVKDTLYEAIRISTEKNGYISARPEKGEPWDDYSLQYAVTSGGELKVVTGVVLYGRGDSNA